METIVREVKPNDEMWPQVAALFPDAASWLKNRSDDGDYHFFAATNKNGVLLGASVIDIGTLGLGPLTEGFSGYGST